MAKKKTRTRSIAKIIEPWLEMDLTAMARAGQLEPAFEVDDLVGMVGGLVDAGRNPVLIGDHGVGKTAVVHELVRRSHAGTGSSALRKCRVLQISLQRRASSLKDSHQICDEMRLLVDALRRTSSKLALFIRDLSLAYDYDLEPQLAALAYAFRGPLIGEGTERDITALLEYEQGLRRHFLTVRVDEPSIDKARVILRAWGQARRETRGQDFSTGAIEQALLLSHRFLTRGRLPRKAVDLLDESAMLAGPGSPITEKDVLDRFCVMHRTPRVLVDPSMPLDIDRLRQRFNDQVVGQDEAVGAVLGMISMIKAGLSDDRRPLGVFLLAGPTGVGKTYLAQLLAEHLFGDRDRMIRLNLADHPGGCSADELFGNAGGGDARERAGVLARRLLRMPFGIVLLDEFEKSDDRVHDRFLQLFDEGAFICGNGETVSCRSWIIVATTNAGWESTPGAHLGYLAHRTTNRRARADVTLERHFRPELLNRFDRIVHFRPLAAGDVRLIAEREIERLGDRIGMEQRRLTLRADPAVVDWVLARDQVPNSGARFLRRTIERHVTGALADLIVRRNPRPGATIALFVENNAIATRIIETKSTRDTAAPVITRARARCR